MSEEDPIEGSDPDRRDPTAGETGLDPDTDELFAFSAGLEDGPELDPVFRSALLESTESATGEHPTGQPAAGATGEHSKEFPEGDSPPADSAATEDDEPRTDEEGASTITEEQTAILAAAARSEVHEALDRARQSGQAWDPPRPPATGDFESPPSRPRYWWRFGLATAIVVLAFAGATSASILRTVDDITGQLSDPGFENLSAKILPPSNGGAQTIALLGTDVRTGGGASPGDPGRSDTTILLRLDPDSDQISMLSIPRDLKVEIPGVGTDKFNAAYAYGGTKLTLQTIRDLTGLQINHVISVDFQGFADAVDAIGCVYVDVDRDYFNSNEGKAPSEMYAEIDIDPGYQKLCGPDALEYARYRHTDTDLVRSSRQQDLIGEVRNRLSFGEIIKRRNELIDAFTENTRSDISGSKESLELLRLLFDSRGARVVEVPFPATLAGTYVTATDAEIQTAVDRFLGFDEPAGPVGTLNEGKGGPGANKKKKGTKAARSRVPKKGEDGLVDAFDSTIALASQIDAEIGSRAFPVYYPKSLPPSTIIAEGSRGYHVRDQDKNSHAAYRMVFALLASDGTHYFGLQGLRGWENPPILEAPYEEVSSGGRNFRVYTEGDRVRLVAWFSDGNVYWISNSLLLTLDNDEMLGMARSTRLFTRD
ncbi:MAG: LCP family protein [Solirubrobacterales bacterium]